MLYYMIDAFVSAEDWPWWEKFPNSTESDRPYSPVDWAEKKLAEIKKSLGI